MKIKSFINNPVLRYKLDPGEPGLATPTPASLSIAKIATHEGANIRRFKREAIEDGGTVVYSSISLNISYQGSFLAATSGESKALIVYPVKKEKADPIIFDTPPEKIDKISINENDNKKSHDSINNTEKNINQNEFTVNDELTKIINSIKQLENEKTMLLRQLVRHENGEPGYNKAVDLQQKINKINSRIDQLKQEIKTENLNAVLSSFVQREELSNKLINLKYGLNEKDIKTGIYINEVA